MSNERLEVRCCCHPARLYGTLKVPRGFLPHRGYRLTLPVLGGEPITLTVEEWHERRLVDPIPAGEYYHYTQRHLSRGGVAFKMDDNLVGTPQEKMELLRRVPGFVENPQWTNDSY